MASHIEVSGKRERGEKKKEVANLCTSSEDTFNNFDAAMNMSGAGFRFSKASADTMASNLYKRGINP